MPILPLHRCHQHRRCHLRHPPHSRVSMWHPTTTRRVCHPTRLPTRNTNLPTHNTYRFTNRYVSEPRCCPIAHRTWCHLASRSQCYNPPLPRVGRLHHQIFLQQILALSQTSRSLSGPSFLLLQPKTHPSRYVLFRAHFSLTLLMFPPRFAHFTSPCLAWIVPPCRMS
jgi:hypothetical protein